MRSGFPAIRQKNILSFLLSAAILAIGFALQNLAPALQNTPTVSAPDMLAPTSMPSYPVAKVVDGDTIKIAKDGRTTTVRLIGLDTPEVVDPRRPVQCYGKEASRAAKELLAGKSVRIEGDPSQDEYDKYGRLLAYVFVDGLPVATDKPQDERSLFNIYMIREGYGHEYTYRYPYKYQARFKAAEEDARQNKRGLWAPGVCE